MDQEYGDLIQKIIDILEKRLGVTSPDKATAAQQAKARKEIEEQVRELVKLNAAQKKYKESLDEKIDTTKDAEEAIEKLSQATEEQEKRQRALNSALTAAGKTLAVFAASVLWQGQEQMKRAVQLERAGLGAALRAYGSTDTATGALNEIVGKIGLPVEELQATLSEFSQGAAVFGLSKFTSVIDQTRSSFATFGMTLNEGVRATADFIEQNRVWMAQQQISDTQAAAIVKRNLQSTTQFANILGISRKEMEARSRMEQQDAAVKLFEQTKLLNDQYYQDLKKVDPGKADMYAKMMYSKEMTGSMYGTESTVGLMGSTFIREDLGKMFEQGRAMAQDPTKSAEDIRNAALSTAGKQASDAERDEAFRLHTFANLAGMDTALGAMFSSNEVNAALSSMGDEAKRQEQALKLRGQAEQQVNDMLKKTGQSLSQAELEKEISKVHIGLVRANSELAGDATLLASMQMDYATNSLKSGLDSILGAIGNIVASAFGSSEEVTKMIDAVSSSMQTVGAFIKQHTPVITAVIRTVISTIAASIRGVAAIASTITNTVSFFVNLFTLNFDEAANSLRSLGTTLKDNIGAMVLGAIAMVAAITLAFGKIKAITGGLSSVMGGLGGMLGRGRGGAAGAGGIAGAAGEAAGGVNFGGIGANIAKLGKGIGAGLGAILSSTLKGLASGLQALGNPKVLLGTLALAGVGGAIFIAAKAFQQFQGIDWDNVWQGMAVIGVMGVGAAILGLVAKFMILGAAGLAVFSGAVWLFAFAMEKAMPSIIAMTDGFMGVLQNLSTLDPNKLLLIGPALAAVGVGLAALSGGSAIGAIIDGLTSLFGGDSPIEKLSSLGKSAEEINKLSDSLKSLDFSEFKSLEEINDILISEKLSRVAGSLSEVNQAANRQPIIPGIMNIANRALSFVGAPEADEEDKINSTIQGNRDESAETLKEIRKVLKESLTINQEQLEALEKITRRVGASGGWG